MKKRLNKWQNSQRMYKCNLKMVDKSIILKYVFLTQYFQFKKINLKKQL